MGKIFNAAVAVSMVVSTLMIRELFVVQRKLIELDDRVFKLRSEAVDLKHIMKVMRYEKKKTNN